MIKAEKKGLYVEYSKAATWADAAVEADQGGYRPISTQELWELYNGARDRLSTN